MQETVADRKVLVKKVAGGENPADVLTKYLGADGIGRAVQRMSILLLWRPLSRRARAEGKCGNKLAIP